MSETTATQTHYLDSLAESMHAHRKKTVFFVERLRAYARERGVEPSQVNVLELGCGNGRIVSLPVAEQGFEVLGVDVHEPSVDSAREYGVLPNASFVVASVEEFVADRRFHAVILSDVLEHVDDPGALLRKSAAVLVDGGMVLVSVPNGHGPYELEQRFARTRAGRAAVRLSRGVLVAGARAKRKVKGLPWPPPDAEDDRPAYNDESGHVQFFRMADLEQLFEQAGLTVTATRNGAFVGGDVTYALFEAVPKLIPLSLRLADALPARMAGTWYFDCRLRSPRADSRP